MWKMGRGGDGSGWAGLTTMTVLTVLFACPLLNNAWTTPCNRWESLPVEVMSAWAPCGDPLKDPLYGRCRCFGHEALCRIEQGGVVPSLPPAMLTLNMTISSADNVNFEDNSSHIFQHVGSQLHELCID